MFLAVWLTNTLFNFGLQIQAVGAARVRGGSRRVRHQQRAARSLADPEGGRHPGRHCVYRLSTPAVLLLTFVLGCGPALSSPAAQAAVGELVPPAEVAGAGAAARRPETRWPSSSWRKG